MSARDFRNQLLKLSSPVNRVLRALAGEDNDILYRFFQLLAAGLITALLVVVSWMILNSPWLDASSKPSAAVERPTTATRTRSQAALPTKHSTSTPKPPAATRRSSAGLAKIETAARDFTANPRVLRLKDGTDVPVAVSQNVHNRFWAALENSKNRNRNENGKAGLIIALAISSDLIRWTPSETKCQLIDAGVASSKVRLVNGPYSGDTVFVRNDFIHAE